MIFDKTPVNNLLISVAAFFIIPQSVYAQDTSFQSETEAGAVVVTGNSKSESYTVKTNNIYTADKDTYKLFGRYLRTTANSAESARSWEAGARYERALNDSFSGFFGHKAEADVYSGYIQRNSDDLGAKYFINKSDELTWIAELGYRYSTTYLTTAETSYDSYGRLYTEIKKSINESVMFRYWIEYLPNFSKSEAYLANTEASLSIMLSEMLSLKLSYLMQYQNVATIGGERLDTTYTTSLVAKF